MATVLENFGKWKEFLGDKVSQARATGMSNETISKLALNIGEFLEDKIDPKNREEQLLKELWDVGNEEEKQALASLMVKLVEGQK